MKALRFALAVATLALVAAGCDLADDAGAVRSQTRSVSAFDRIEVGGRTDVTIRPGRPRLTLRGGAQLLDDVNTTVDGGRLTIDRIGSEQAPLDVSITMPRLRAVDADSAGEIGIVDLGAETLALRHGGAGLLRATGRAGTLVAVLSGVGKLELFELAADRARVRLSGAGSAEVDVREHLDATVTGVGAIRFRGDPTVRRDVSGLGDVRPAR